MQLDLPLPTALVRDLLAITRVVYRGSRAAGDGADRLEELTAIGQKLKTALELAQAKPGTMGHRAAWKHAEEALERLARVIGADEKTLTLLAVVGDEFGRRSTGVQSAALSEREAKRRARLARS